LFWDKGFRWYSPDERMRFKFAGKWMAGFTWADGDQLEQDTGVDFNNSVRCRRVRPYLAGEIGDTFAFKIEGDFSGSGAKLIDAYLQFRQVPYVGNVTVGHIKEPFGLERLTRAASVTFLERSLANALVPPGECRTSRSE